MKKTNALQIFILLLGVGSGLGDSWSVAREIARDDQPVHPLVDWEKWPNSFCTVSNADARPDERGWLVVRPLAEGKVASLVMEAAGQSWNLQSFAEIALPIRNCSSNNIRIILRVDDGNTRGIPARGGHFEAVVSPGPDSVWLVVPLGNTTMSSLAGDFTSMVAKPVDFVRPGVVVATNVVAVSLSIIAAQVDQSIAVGPVVARGVPARFGGSQLAKACPLVDEFGQYAYRDWPSKIHAKEDFKRQFEQEELNLADNPRPLDWNKFGGWLGGPQLKATGFFRVEKVNGIWWMVDPEGRLFWSHGVVRVGTRIRVGGVYRGTPLPEREQLFNLPARNSPLGEFYGTEPQATRGYYVGRDNHSIYDYLEANLFRKYGPHWSVDYAKTALRRLGSWGLNTIANSSDPGVYLMRKTPYTAIVYTAPLGREEHRIEGSDGAWGKFPDPFDPEWHQLIVRTLQTELKESLNDPWCLGFFADNEMHWGDNFYLAEATLKSSARQPAKQYFLEELKEKYKTISALNSAWKADYETWAAFLTATNVPNRANVQVQNDLMLFSELIIKAYFRSCRDAIKGAAPHHLYLGCRFAGANSVAMRLAARYCDVVSLNRYQHEVSDLALPAGGDNRPILIGEFHFTTLDGGMFPPGLILVANQRDRARAYRTYVTSALRNPAIIGTHWFQFYDQPTTGRFDGENFQTGLLDICDTPYAETIDAVRQTGLTMYQTRVGTSATKR